MYKSRLLLHLILLLFVLSPISLIAQKAGEDLRKNLLDFKKEQNFASISVALIKGQNIVWKDAVGKADRENDIDFTTKHLFCLGSVSKLFTGTALLKLYEDGKLNLDDDVNEHLPFPIRNPKFPDIPITIRMVLTHTSSFGDYRSLQDSLYASTKGDPHMPLAEVAEGFFDPAGKFYRENNYLEFEPGSRWQYSNWNFVLVGYLIERITGEVFREHNRNVLIDPLDMKSSGWFSEEINIDNVSIMYRQLDSGKFRRINPIYSWPGYSDGMLRSNVEDASNFVIMLLNQGSFNGKQILKPETVNEMLSFQNIPNIPEYFSFRDMGLVWFVPRDTGNIFIHSGSPSNSVAMMWIDPDKNTGLVAYITGLPNQMMGIYGKIDAFVKNLLNVAGNF